MSEQQESASDNAGTSRADDLDQRVRDERLRVSVRTDIHHLIQPVIGHIRMFTEGDWATPNREHMEGWVKRLRAALSVVDALGDDEARAALAGTCGLGHATTPEDQARTTDALRQILGGESA